MAVTSQYEEISALLKAVIDTEFAPEGIAARHDNVHESLGHKYPVVGIAPVRDTPMLNNMATLETWVEVRFFDKYNREINPEQAVDPRTITNTAERLRRAIQGTNHLPGTSRSWFMNVVDISYPDDPTGNKSRFVMTIRAFGQNPAIVETTG